MTIHCTISGGIMPDSSPAIVRITRIDKDRYGLAWESNHPRKQCLRDYLWGHLEAFATLLHGGQSSVVAKRDMESVLRWMKQEGIKHEASI